MPSRSQLVCQLCVRTSMHNCVSAGHRQHPHKSSCRTVPWENVPTAPSEEGGTYQWEEESRQDLPGQPAGYQCGFCVNPAAPAVQTLCARVALHQESCKSDRQHTNKGIFCPEQPFCWRLSTMCLFCIRSLSGEVSQGWVRIRCPHRSHGHPGVAHTGSLLVLCIQSLSQVLRPPLSPTVFSSPYLPYLRSIRDTEPELGRPLRSDLPPCTCPPALGGVNSRAQLF